MEEEQSQSIFTDLQQGTVEGMLIKLRKEFNSGDNWVRTKRDTKLKERELYVKEAGNDKINIHSIYLQMQMLLALYYQDKTTVRYVGRSIFTEELADNITKVAEFDAEQMDLDTIDYDVEFDRFFVGVGVKTCEGWNNETKAPYARHIDTLSVIPDPNGGYRAKNHSFIGFSLKMTKEEMREKGYKNIELIQGITEEERKKELAYNRARGYTTWGNESDLCSVYCHFMQYEGYKYLVVVDGKKTTPLEIIYLEPETEAEKANPLLVPYPVSFKYFSPLKGDFYGISVPDLLKDKQTRFSRLFNLEYQKALRQVLGDDKLYDPNRIKDVRDLTKPSVEPRYIEGNVEPGESLEGAIITVPKESIPNSVGDMKLALQQQMTESIGLDKNTLGVGADSSRTLGEAQLIQQNANVRLGLISRFSRWGDEDFWRLYYRSIQYNLSGEKVIRLTRSFGDYYVNFKREDIVGTTSIDVKIVTQSELEAQRAKESSLFFSTFATDIATATTEVAKNFLMRKKYRLQGWSPDEIKMVVRDTKEEILAKQDVQRLNYGLEALDVEEGQDHQCFLAYYEGAIDNEKSRKAKEKRKQALFLMAMNTSGVQTKEQEGLLASQANSSASQLTSQSIRSIQESQGQGITASPSSPLGNG